MIDAHEVEAKGWRLLYMLMLAGLIAVGSPLDVVVLWAALGTTVMLFPIVAAMVALWAAGAGE